MPPGARRHARHSAVRGAGLGPSQTGRAIGEPEFDFRDSALDAALLAAGEATSPTDLVAVGDLLARRAITVIVVDVRVRRVAGVVSGHSHAALQSVSIAVRVTTSNRLGAATDNMN